MKTITLTDDELEYLVYALWENPCDSVCLLGNTKIKCDDVNENGTYKCKFQRSLLSIGNKIGMFE
jgi:hypothetical protein